MLKHATGFKFGLVIWPGHSMRFFGGGNLSNSISPKTFCYFLCKIHYYFDTPLFSHLNTWTQTLLASIWLSKNNIEKSDNECSHHVLLYTLYVPIMFSFTPCSWRMCKNLKDDYSTAPLRCRPGCFFTDLPTYLQWIGETTCLPRYST